MDATQFNQLFTAMQDQQAKLAESNDLLRQELAAQATRFTAAQTASDRNIAALMESMSPDRNLEHTGVLPPHRYPKLDDFKLDSKDDADARTVYFLNRQAWGNRLELEGDHKAALLEMKLKRDRHRLHGDYDLQPDALSELAQCKDAYKNAIFRKPPPTRPTTTSSP